MTFKCLLTILIVLTFFPLSCSKTVEIEKVSADGIKSKAIEEKNEQVGLPKIETAEEKAIRFAEEFISRNGYTQATPDKGNLSHETVEFYNNIEELLALRKDTLEPKAYGIFYGGRLGDEKGWTVVFKYSERLLKNKERVKFPPNFDLKKIGRAVTMSENFQNLLVEHKDFPLPNVEKIVEK